MTEKRWTRGVRLWPNASIQNRGNLLSKSRCSRFSLQIHSKHSERNNTSPRWGSPSMKSSVPSRTNHGVFHWKFNKRKTYKKNWGAKLQVIKRKITTRSPLRFLRKCAGGSLISARPLCLVDDAIDRSSNVDVWEFLLTWFQRFLERGSVGPKAHHSSFDDD